MKKLNQFRILIVDDEPDLLHLFSLQFKLRGADVQTAQSGNKALEILKTTEFDLVISDVRMANGDGVTLLKGLKGLRSTMPVFFFMTGFSDFTNDEAKRMGANEVLNKPFDQLLLDEYLLKYFPNKVAA